MITCQDPPLSPDALELRGERLGPLPLINRFLDRLGLEALLERFVPTTDRRVRLPYAKALGLLLRSILVEREPFYRQHETVSTFASAAFGLTDELALHAGDEALFQVHALGLFGGWVPEVFRGDVGACFQQQDQRKVDPALLLIPPRRGQRH